jgi:SAM-dependent methyltransferase
MYNHHYKVRGIDFSSYGIEQQNPHLAQFFSEGNIYAEIQNIYERNELFDVIFTGNVIEHIISPENFLIGIKKILQPQGLLIIVAPNDFSELQNHLLEIGNAENPWWLAYPDHISYFTYDSMRNFLTEFGFEIKVCLGDFPMELALFSDLTNYVKNRSVGPGVHQLRVNIENYIFDKDPQKLIELSILFGNLRIGRNLIYFCERSNQ